MLALLPTLQDNSFKCSCLFLRCSTRTRHWTWHRVCFSLICCCLLCGLLAALGWGRRKLLGGIALPLCGSGQCHALLCPHRSCRTEH